MDADRAIANVAFYILGIVAVVLASYSLYNDCQESILSLAESLQQLKELPRREAILTLLRTGALAAAWFFCTVLSVAPVLAAHNLYSSLSLYGTRHLRRYRGMPALILESTINFRYTCAGFFSAVALGIWAWYLGTIAVVYAGAAWATATLYGRLKPPDVLYLATSDADQVRFHNRLARGLFLFRPVSLLQSDDHNANKKIRRNCFRVSSESNWRATVFTLIEQAPLVVIDARVESPAVLEEAEFLIDSDWLFKTFVVHEDKNRTSSVLQAVRRAPQHLVAVIHPDEVGPVLDYISRSRRRLPNREQPTAQLANVWRLTQETA